MADKYGFHKGEDYLTFTKNDEPIMGKLYPTVGDIKHVRKILIALNSQDELLAALKRSNKKIQAMLPAYEVGSKSADFITRDSAQDLLTSNAKIIAKAEGIICK